MQLTESPPILVLPSRDRAYLGRVDARFEELKEGAQAGLALRGHQLPSGKFDSAIADVLFLLPPGYPDVPIDMFYLFPWVRLTSKGAYANATDHPHSFAGRVWQRWSRHNPEWQPGKDGIWTMIARMNLALRDAA